MPTKWESLRKSLSSIRTSMTKMGSHRDSKKESKRIVQETLKRTKIFVEEYDLNYNKLQTFGKDSRIIKVEKFIADQKKANLPSGVKAYFEFLEKESYKDYINEKFGGVKRGSFVSEVSGGPSSFSRMVAEMKDVEQQGNSSVIIKKSEMIKNLWKTLDLGLSRTQKEVDKMLAFKKKVEELVSVAFSEINKIQKAKIVIGKANVQHPDLISELTKKINKR